MSTRTIVDVDGLRLVIGTRRHALRDRRDHLRRGRPADAPAPGLGCVLDRIAELDELEVLLEQHIAEHGTEDVTRVVRPGVLLVGAGESGAVTVEADLEHLDPSLLTDRDLAVYTGLVRYVLERLERETVRRVYEPFPRRWVTGYVGDLDQAVGPLVDPATDGPTDTQERQA